MRSQIRTYVVPALTALLAAFFIMMLFEYVNSHFYPLPADLDWKDRDAVVAFTDSLPWTAYILVLMGWIIGSYVGGYSATRLAPDHAVMHALVVGGILSLMGLLNNMMLGHSVAFSLVTVPLFCLFAYLGHRAYHQATATT